MIAAPFTQLVWKEYRQLRSFWLAIALLGLIAQFVVWKFANVDKDWWIFAIALTAAAGYAIGASAQLFAVEHEVSTFSFLRNLPMDGGLLARGKLSFTLLSIVALQAVLWFSAAAITGWQFPSPSTAREIWAFGGMACLEGLAWGVLCSLLLREPLQAAVVALFATTLGVHAAVWLVDTRASYSFDLGLYITALPYRAMIAAAVVALDLWLMPRWLTDRIRRLRLPLPAMKSIGLKFPKVERQPKLFIAIQPLSNLIWQAWREARPRLWLLAAVGATIATMAPGRSGFGTVMLTGMVVGAFCGLFVFRADQNRQRRRFLSDRGISPTLIWLSRQLVWTAILLVWTVSVVIVAIRFSVTELAVLVGLGPSPDWHLNRTIVLLGCVPLAYAAGQIASQFVSSGLLAAVIGLPLAALVCAWTTVMNSLGINWMWSVLPIFLVLLRATWVRTPDWLVERRDLRSWVRPVVAFALLIGFLGVAVPLYRVFQIPESRYSAATIASASAKETPESLATLKLYLSAWEAYRLNRHFVTLQDEEPRDPFAPPRPPTTEEVEVVTKNEMAISLALRASERETCYFPSREDDPNPNAYHEINTLGELLLVAAAVHQTEGKLDDAADCYFGALGVFCHLWERPEASRASVYDDVLERLPGWAAATGQTSERILAMLRRLDEFHHKMPSAAVQIRANYLRQRKGIDNYVGAHPKQKALFEIWLASTLPWERARSVRLLNWMTSYDLGSAEWMQQSFAKGESVESLFPDYRTSDYNHRFGDSIGQLLETTPLVHHLQNFGPQFCWDAVVAESRFRATQILVALERWKLSHGKLPERLEQLIGDEFKQLPVDPYTGGPFLYYPYGLPVDLSIGPDIRNEFDRLPANQPFLWTTVRPDSYVYLPARVHLAPLGPEDTESERSFPYRSEGSSDQPDPEFPYEVLRAGWPYPIR